MLELNRPQGKTSWAKKETHSNRGDTNKGSDIRK